jgi:NAD(P) transhydrogenase subunit beta
MLAMIVGAITFSGSMIAAGKLQGIVNERPITYPFQNIINLIFFLTIVAAGGLSWLSALVTRGSFSI